MPTINCDFSGWAATNNVRCSDNTIIRPGAFKDNDGMTVPLVWQHSHDDVTNVLGHALLKNNDPKGVYMYGFFNGSDEALHAKDAIKNGDIKAISIFANQLKRRKSAEGDEILHGNIREVSLVLAGADPGAFIDYIKHSDDGESEEAIIYNDSEIVIKHDDLTEEGKEDEDMPTSNISDNNELEHSDEDLTVKDVIDSMDEKQQTVLHALISKAYEQGKEDLKHADDKKGNEEKEDDVKDLTIKDVIESMNEQQLTVLKYLIAKAFDEGQNSSEENESTDDKDDTDEGDAKMKHDVFDNDTVANGSTLSHSDLNNLCVAAREDARNYGGSFRDAFIAHADEDYGITNVNYLFPDAKALTNQPEFIKRQTEWVAQVTGGTKHVPYTRIKSLFADITETEARAKGYVKGAEKVNEFFALAKRETTPTTIYKKQQLDRDDIIDATTIDVVSWLWQEMRLMLDEELARAILIGDGRAASSPDKISETNIRPILSDAELFTVEQLLSANAAADTGVMIEEISKTNKNYRGTGSPVFFTSVDVHTNMLWVKDDMGRRIYDSDEQLCSALRVSKIIEVPAMEGLTHTFSGRTDIANGTYDFAGLKVNLTDYAVGTDRGGEINNFTDFDIDYNQYKYLLETRCSGALIRYHAAQAYWLPQSNSLGGNS